MHGVACRVWMRMAVLTPPPSRPLPTCAHHAHYPASVAGSRGLICRVALHSLGIRRRAPPVLATDLEPQPSRSTAQAGSSDLPLPAPHTPAPSAAPLTEPPPVGEGPNSPEARKVLTLNEIDRSRLPTHIAVIMDGNSRWASALGFPQAAGYAAGVEALRRLVASCIDLKEIEVLTVYAFSVENWGRPSEEIDGLLSLVQRIVASEAQPLRDAGVSLRFVGDLERLPAKLRQSLDEAVALKPEEGCTRLTLCVALSYGGRQELARAAQSLAARAVAGDLDVHAIDENVLAEELRTSGYSVPTDPDLLIRTGGQQRLSNFLLFQCAYTELVSLACLWPDFGQEQLAWALREYASRARTFGKTHVRGTQGK